MKVKESILEGYASEEGLLRDVYLLQALTKIEQYGAECEFFEKKYSVDLKTFERQLHRDKGKENFQKEEDLEDWEFAHNALYWWEKKLKELRRAADA